MSIKEEFKDVREKFRLLSLYQRFEHLVVMFLTALIAVIVIAAVWNLSLKILFGLVLSGSLDPSDYSVFQAVFGMMLVRDSDQRISEGASEYGATSPVGDVNR